jgi:hypothetical protein
MKSRLKKYEIRISVSILEGTNTRASGIRGYFPQLLKLQVFLEYHLHVEGIILYY